MQHDITAQGMTNTQLLERIIDMADQTDQEIRDAIAKLNQLKAERRARELEAKLINRNPTTDRILEACHRTQWRWTPPKEE